MKKKLLALIIAASFAICGCGSGSSTTSSAAEESAESEESGFVGLEYFEKLAPEGIDAKLWIVETGREEHEKECIVGRFINNTGKDISLNFIFDYGDLTGDTVWETELGRNYVGQGETYWQTFDMNEPFFTYAIDYKVGEPSQSLAAAYRDASVESTRNADDSIQFVAKTENMDYYMELDFIFFDEEGNALGHEMRGYQGEKEYEDFIDSPPFKYADYVVSFSLSH